LRQYPQLKDTVTRAIDPEWLEKVGAPDVMTTTDK